MALNKEIMYRDLECDMVIVGDGIVGTTLASALKDSGIKIIIIEANPLEVAAARKQAYAFSLLSSRIYQGIGVWDKIFSHVGKFKNIRLSELKCYENWRKQQNLAILGFTDFLDRFFSNNWLPVLIVRRLSLWVMANIKPMKMFALKLMTGLKGKAPKLADVANL